jgi:transcription termination factor Rho
MTEDNTEISTETPAAPAKKTRRATTATAATAATAAPATRKPRVTKKAATSKPAVSPEVENHNAAVEQVDFIETVKPAAAPEPTVKAPAPTPAASEPAPAAPVPPPANTAPATPADAPAQDGRDRGPRGNRRDRFRRDRRNRHDQNGGQNGGQNAPQAPAGDREAAQPSAQPAQPAQPATPPAPPAPPAPPTYAEGIVEVSGKGFGFLREPRRNFSQSNNDVFVTPEVVRKHNLRDGMWIKGETRRGSRGPQLFKLTELEGQDPDTFPSNFPVFEELTTISPNKRVKLETTPDRHTTRVMDIMTPVGKGQRGLIVAPPRTGKTTLLQHIADAVVKNHPEMKLIILLVDERPEEVTEIRRTVPTAELMASSNDSDIKTHTRIAQLASERAKRLVEMGKDVFMLMDSLTRIGRAFNNAQGGGGRTMSGGVDSRALEIPRKIFAAARNTEEAGSLTIMATALIETNSRMDDLIFQEFKGTGNMELVLDRKISDQRIYPAVDIFLSGTRREELLLSPEELHKISVIRRGLAGHKPIEAIERLLFFIKKYPTNTELLKNIPG